MTDEKKEVKVSVEEFLQDLFDKTLSNENQFDPEIVQLIDKHLGQRRIHTKAGNNLAEALIELAITRSQVGEK